MRAKKAMILILMLTMVILTAIPVSAGLAYDFEPSNGCCTHVDINCFDVAYLSSTAEIQGRQQHMAWCASCGRWALISIRNGVVSTDCSHGGRNFNL